MIGFIVRVICWVIAWNLIPDSAHWYTKLGILLLAGFEVKFTTTRTTTGYHRLR